MASGIVDCCKRTINVGDQVKTPNGKVITVRGAAVGVQFYNAEECELLCADGTVVEATRKPKKVKDENGDDILLASAELDCVVWGD